MTEPSTNKVVLTVRLEEDFHQQLTIKAAQERIASFQALIHGWLSEWVAGKKPASQKTEPARQKFDVSAEIEPYVREFARWLTEPARSDKEEELKSFFKKMFEPKQIGRQKRA